VKEEISETRKGAAMPAGNGMGPMGMGPMTGRAAGFCAGFGMPGYMNMIQGGSRGLRGRGMGGGGGGRGWRHMFCATGLFGWQRTADGWPMAGGAPSREQQLDALKGQAEYFEGALGDLRKRIEELESVNPAK